MKKNIVITGASDGIGAQAARQLKAKGHHVILVGRSKVKTESLGKELDAPFHLADYTDLSDVRRLADELKAYDRIDVLANNAGGIMGDRVVTKDGFEKTFQVNHLAPFLLTNVLLDKLIENSAVVIQTSSIAANIFGQGFNVEDLNNERQYQAQCAYGHGKLANILFTRELDRRFRDKGIKAVAFHPGVVRSSFAHDTNHIMHYAYHTPIKYLMTISPAQSAKRLVAFVDGEPGKDWILGEVYDKSRLMSVKFKDDGSVARSLWEQSEKMVQSLLRVSQKQYQVQC